MTNRESAGRSDNDSPSTSPGWDAISDALSAVHGAQVPRHWGDVTARLIGPLRLDGLDAYDAGDHWHFVTLGLPEIWGKETDDRAVSGLGFEYTMRVRRVAGDEPPPWAVRLLNRLGEAALGGHPMSVGHTLDPGGPITGADDTSLTALCFVSDPTLPPMQTPNGSVAFVQAVGATKAELDRIRADSARVDDLATPGGLFVTDPFR